MNYGRENVKFRSSLFKGLRVEGGASSGFLRVKPLNGNFFIQCRKLFGNGTRRIRFSYIFAYCLSVVASVAFRHFQQCFKKFILIISFNQNPVAFVHEIFRASRNFQGLRLLPLQRASLPTTLLYIQLRKFPRLRPVQKSQPQPFFRLFPFGF